MIQRNPFLSERFTAIWSKHFVPSAKMARFSFLPALKWVKHGFLPLYTNVGKAMTKGMSYRFGDALSGDADETTPSRKAESPGVAGSRGNPEPFGTSAASKTSQEHRKKVFLIYDVPAYFEVPSNPPDAPLALHRSRQYPGFLIDTAKFKDLNDYLLNNFSKSSRYKLKKYKKRFEASFDVRYVMYRGDMERQEYDLIFEGFRQLLEKRFDDKQITNNNLDPREWQFYHEVTYPMLLENEASLFVIYNGDEPIGVTLNFFSEDILFDAITVFDIDYFKFHLGSITIMALLDWCFANNMRVFDFSKGYFDYKTRWATRAYDFEYHILYDSESFRARTLAFGLKKFFDFKQRLREKKVNDHLHRLTYKFKRKKATSLETKCYTFSELELESHPDAGASSEIDLQHRDNHLIRLMVFEYLYLNDGHYRDIKVYPVPDKTDQYYIINKTKTVLATLK